MHCKTLKVTPSCIPRRPCPLTARQGWDPGVCSPPFPRPLFPCSSFFLFFRLLIAVPQFSPASSSLMTFGSCCPLCVRLAY